MCLTQFNEATNIIHSIIKKKMMDEHISEDEAKHRLGIEFWCKKISNDTGCSAAGISIAQPLAAVPFI